MDTSIANRLAARRRAAGYSQEALAGKLGVSRQAVSKWERGEASPDTDNLIALAALYGVTLDELLYAEPLQEAESAAGPGEDGEKGAEPEVDAEKGAGATDAAHGDADPSSDAAKPSVHVSLKDGIHVSDPKKGEEVHVGWGGIHVTDPAKGAEVHVGPEGVDVHDEHGHSVVSDAEGGGVTVDGTHYESWKAVHDALGHDLRGKSDFERAWERFPFFALVPLAYVCLGLFAGTWLEGLWLLLLIPVYPAVGTLVASRDLIDFLAGMYPVGATAWFLWQVLARGEAHPSWVIFLTIPLVEWALGSLADWKHGRK